MSDNAKTNKKKLALIAAWIVLLCAVLGTATYAWFSFLSYTKITPMSGAVGDGTVELLISSNETGPFSEETELIIDGNPENLQPVSTPNLHDWFVSAGNSSAGIANSFVDISDKINEMSLYGKLYLKCQGGDCFVYLNKDEMTFGLDDQMVSSCRLGLNITTKTDGEKTIILKLDDFIGSGGAESKSTMNDENVVIESVDGSGQGNTANDPSELVSDYAAVVTGNTLLQGERSLCKLQDEEVGCIEYRLYMEGCDENCINESQEKEIDLKFAFAGIEAK